MASPRISCVIPVHNGERYLAEAIESVLAQTAPPAEVIVVDDGSTDRSFEIARSFDPPVRCERQARRGVSAARNRGVRMAEGDLACFLDADDLFVDRKLELQGQRFVERPELELCAALTENFWSADLPEDERTHMSVMRSPWPGSLITWMFRPAFFERIGGFDETMRLSQDVDWHMRAVSGGAVTETLPIVLSRRRLHRHNNTRFARDECRTAVLQSLRRHVIAPRRRLLEQG